MEPGFQAMVDCMLEAGWTRREAQLAIAHAKFAPAGRAKLKRSQPTAAIG